MVRRGEDGLSKGEREVLRLAAKGYTIEYIAYLRGTARNTIRVQLVNARAALGVKTRAEALEYARKRWPL